MTLAERIAASHRNSDSRKYREVAEALNARDEKDSQSAAGERSYGQNLRDTFALGDLFVDADDRVKLSDSIRRFVKALFSYQFHTPSRDEYGMFHAMAASRRSADLSRQVGAAITTLEGDVVAVGCNEVPKAGGGLYWEGDLGDRRDHQLGEDIRHEITDVMLREAICKLKETAVGPEAIGEVVQKLSVTDELKETLERNPKFIEDLIEGVFDTLEQEQSKALQGARVKALLEFGRAVHAEMASLSDAALRGIAVRDGTMYVTTLPCHICARHIVAAGIRRVVYIEPYPKSMVRKLYPDSISIDGGRPECVRFEPFFGFAPRIYLNFFDIPDDLKREYQQGGQQAKVIPWTKETMQCRSKRYVSSYLFIEMRALKYIGGKLRAKTDDVAKIRCDEKWVGSNPKRPHHGNKGISDWLEERKTKIDHDLEKAVPNWIKLVILAHEYM